MFTCYDNLDANQKDCRTSNEYFNKSLSFNFEDDGINGAISGRTVNNDVFGEYKLFAGNKIKVTSFDGTRMLEHGWGSDFAVHFKNSNLFQIKSDTLFIYYGAANKRMIFIQFDE